MLRARIQAGEAVFGSYVTFPSPEIVEVFAAAGMDCVIIDLQHSSPDWQTLAHMIRAADARGVSPLVRAYNQDPALLLKILELGAEGLVVPGVRSADDIAAIAAAVYYPPLGHRGACGHTRVAAYNPQRAEFPSHVTRQNGRVFIWALVEDPSAIKMAGEIASVAPGASVIGVGRGDLSTTLGLPGQVDHPEVILAAERVIREVGEHSKGKCASSVMVQKAEDAAAWYKRGCRLFTYNADAILLMKAAQEGVTGLRSAITSCNGADPEDFVASTKDNSL